MRFYFHVHECGEVTRDEEGGEFASLDDARREALVSARQIMCEELKHGDLCLGCFILIENDAHRPIMQVNFRDAVTIAGL